LIGKTVKYMTWASMLIFIYHFILIKKYQQPETQCFVLDPFLEWAKFIDWSIYDLRLLFTKPGMTKMLPDQMKIPGQPTVKTLVINLNGTLVHQTYKLGVGVEVFKRPGLGAFLAKMSQRYEIVIFGLGESGTINEICEALDPEYRMIMGRFGRENTLLKDGKYIKDLSYMNRDVKNMIYIDFTDEAVAFHQDNCILLPKFEGDTSDRELVDLIPFLDRKCISFTSSCRFGQVQRRR
jgi:import inner membrane translocase subunit TIM50